MKIEDKVLEFIIFCVESTAARLQRNGAEVYQEMKRTGALKQYVEPYYDTLHTQGEAYIVDSLLEYIYHRDPLWLPEGYKPHGISNLDFVAACRRGYDLWKKRS